MKYPSAEEFEATRDPDIETIIFPSDDDWIAKCGVCEANFVVTKANSEENPAPHGSFCPDCRHRGLKAPGVLHWSPRSEV